MRFHEAPDMGYYGQTPEFGWYGQAPDPYGYYAEPPELGYYGEPPEIGYYAEPPPEMGWYGEPPDPYGWYAEPPELGYYAEYPEINGYAEPVEYYAEEYPGAAGYAYGQMPEMVGYGEYEPLSEDYPGMAYYGEPEMSGYVRQGPPAYNPGCPMPTNVAGFGENTPLEGYVKPGTVNPACEQFVPQPGPTPVVPDTFRPLW